MPVAASLTVDLGVSTAKLEAGFKKATQETTRFLSEVGNHIAAGVGIGAGINIAGRAIGFVDSLVDGVKAKVDELKHVGSAASQLGIGVEAFQELQQTAAKFGIDTELLEKGLRKLTVTVGTAGEGSVESEKKLARFGLTAADLKTLPLEQQVYRIADAMKKLAPSDRMLAATELFGEKNSQLIKLFSKGSDGIKEYVKHLHDIGTISSPAAVEAAKKLKEAQHELALQWDALVTKVSNFVIPALADLITTLNHAGAIKEVATMDAAIYMAKVNRGFQELKKTVGLGDGHDVMEANRVISLLETARENYLKSLKYTPEHTDGSDQISANLTQGHAFAGALLKGSLEAYQEILKHDSASDDNLLKQMVGEQKQMVEEQRKLNKLIDKQNKKPFAEAKF
jgi:hypothetical protein